MITVNNLCKEYRVFKEEVNRSNFVKHIFCKEYDARIAVSNLSFHIEQGEKVGLIGLNGAGKSTTIKLLAGVLLPTSGMVRINGIDPIRNRIENVKNIGTVIGNRTQLWEDMPLIDSFEMIKHVYRIPERQYREIIKLLCDMLGLHSVLNTSVVNLSLGQRMRADFVCAMLHNPKVLYMDEPTIGLDAVAKENILSFINEVNKSNKTTMIITTHNLMDIEKTCSRVILIDHGAMIYDGSIKRMKEIYAPKRTLQLEIYSGKLPDMQDLPIDKYLIENNHISITYNNKLINSSTIIHHILKQCRIKNVEIEELKLNDIICAVHNKISATDN